MMLSESEFTEFENNGNSY